MLNTVLPVWGVALLLSITCWKIGSALVSSPRPIVAMLCGWCVFLLLCSVPWIFGLPAVAVRPLFWAFFATGITLQFRGRSWPELLSAVVSTTVVAGLLGLPFLRFPDLLAYGAHGLDTWGYINTADWLQGHSIRELPDIGVSPMRYNWTWHVLTTRERPLIYESLACLASATGLSAVNVYLAYPAALMASLAMALAREQGIFQLKCWVLALVPALAAAFHPLIFLPWIAGFLGGTVTALLTAMSFAAVAVPGEKHAQAEALGLAVVMMFICAGLYAQKFVYVGLILGGVPILIWGITRVARRDWCSLPGSRPGPVMTGILATLVVLAVALAILCRDQEINTGKPQWPVTAAGHFLGIFGGSSPFVWLGYLPSGPFDRNPTSNPVGCVAWVVTATMLTLVSWVRWRNGRDIRIPLLVSLCLGLLISTIGDELIMAKALPIFGFALLVLLAAISCELQDRWLGVLAAAICCLPILRSAPEVGTLLEAPFIMCTEKNITQVQDGQDWSILAYLYYREDRDGFNWVKYPRTFHAVTQFLPEPLRQRVAAKHHIIRQ